MASTFQFPTVVSRTLDPAGKALLYIVAMHDRQITDADLNLVQQLQDYKLGNIVKNTGVTSGGLTYSAFTYNTNNPNTFFIPSFDVLFNNTVVTIQGQSSTDLTTNRIGSPIVPAPPPLNPNDEDARIYIVFLELWYQALNPITGVGYYQDQLNPGPKYFYPYGGILPDPSNAKVLPDDSVDPFQGLFTTERAQIQWRFNVQRVALDYDFTQETWGFYYTGARTPGTTSALDPGQIVYGQASLPTVTPGISPLVGNSIYQFTNMGGVNGDTGLWRCGDGNINNSLGTMDGYSYAMPVAVMFQRNPGNFNLATNIFGCASPTVSGSGTLASRVSGRYDNKLADQIFIADVVDTRSTVSLTGIDNDDAMRKGFVDLIVGNTTLAVGRGDPRGDKQEQLGSKLDYYLAVSPTPVTGAETVFAFDRYANGFSSDTRTYYVVKQVTFNQKTVGINGHSWVLNDSFGFSLPQASTATITYVEVACLVSGATNTIKTPTALLQGQVEIVGLNSTAVTITFANNLTGTAFDPGSNNLYVTLGVTYPSGGVGTRYVPLFIQGGVLYDNDSAKTLPVYGVSEYKVSTTKNSLLAYSVTVINPEYSNIIFGNRIAVNIPGSQGFVTTSGSGSSQTQFTIPCKNLNGTVGGLYAISGVDVGDEAGPLTIVSRVMSTDTTGTILTNPNFGAIKCTVTVNGTVDEDDNAIFTMLAQNTCQVAYNPPVKGITEIEETVLFGNYTGDSNFPMDPRIFVESNYYTSSTDTNTIVLGANNCQITGLAGDDSVSLIWIRDSSGNLTSQPVSSVNFSNGMLTITVPGGDGSIVLGPTIGSAEAVPALPFVFVGSITPSLSSTVSSSAPLPSSLTLQIQYIPYQGEGVLNRDYNILHSEDNALITTNGTGAAPVIGLTDVYPYNRELPLIISLPKQSGWLDSTLENDAVATFFDSNYVAMRANNVETTFLAPLHTNDFIPPINKDIRKTVRFTATADRGFGSATPHLGFAIEAPTRSVLGENLQSTQAPITLYVDNINGSDSNTGLSITSAKNTIPGAVSELPPVLRHPCTVILKNTNSPYSIATLSSSLEVIALGDGDIRSMKLYALTNLSRVIQDEGRLVISREATATNTVVIDATGFAGFGDGPTSAFYIENSRVIMNGIQFQGFLNPAITAYSSDVDFVSCVWQNNVQAGSYIGCDSVIFDGGSLSLSTGGTGHVVVQSNLTASNHSLIVNGTQLGAFYSSTRNSTTTLTQYGSSNETAIAPTTVIVNAQLNSSISVDATFQSAGAAVLGANSVLLQTVTVTPFVGGVTTDDSSFVVTQV